MKFHYLSAIVSIGLFLMCFQSQANQCIKVANTKPLGILTKDEMQQFLRTIGVRSNRREIKNQSRNPLNQTNVLFTSGRNYIFPEFYNIETQDYAFAAKTIVNELKNAIKKSDEPQLISEVGQELPTFLQTVFELHTSDQCTVSVSFGEGVEGFTAYVFMDFPIAIADKAHLPIYLSRAPRADHSYSGDRVEIRFKVSQGRKLFEVYSGNNYASLQNGQYVVDRTTSHGLSFYIKEPLPEENSVYIASSFGQSKHFFESDKETVGYDNTPIPELHKNLLKTTLSLVKRFYPNHSVIMKFMDKTFKYPDNG